MSVYAPLPAYADQKRYPRALFLIIAGHAALLAAVMTAKMEMPPGFIPTVTKVDLIPLPPEPPQNPPPEHQQKPVIDTIQQVVPIPLPPQPNIDRVELPIPNLGPGPVVGPDPGKDVTPAAPIRVGPRFITSPSELRPPYPQQKIRMQEETVLRLRLAIDEHGRVTSVDPVGAVDPVFLSAARRHLIAHWRYQPATEDGHAVASSTVITLHFELND